MSGSGPRLTPLFARMRDGDAEAVNGVMSACMRRSITLPLAPCVVKRRNTHCKPTAPVNETYLRLVHGRDIVRDRQHFLAIGAQAMRRVYIVIFGRDDTTKTQEHRSGYRPALALGGSHSPR